MSKHVGTILCVIVAALVILLLAWCGPARTSDTGAASASPSPSASATATPPPVVVPASASVVMWARHWRRAAVRSWRKWNHARWCLTMPHRAFASRRPLRSASAATWTKAAHRWKAMRRDYRHRTRKLVHHMRRPGGNGAARWAPLLRWTGWEPWAIPGAVAIMTRESSGSPHEWNRTGSRCYGLFQLAPCWWPRGFAWIYNPENQARKAWHIFHVVQHDSWLPAWGL